MSSVNDEVQTGDLATGLFELLKPIVEKCDGNIHAVHSSQVKLAGQLDKLSDVLQTFIDDGSMPEASLDVYGAKLLNSKKRITNVNSTLKEIQNRLRRITESSEYQEALQNDESRNPVTALEQEAALGHDDVSKDAEATEQVEPKHQRVLDGPDAEY